MKNLLDVLVPETIDDVLNNSRWSERYYAFSADKDNDFINEPDRAARCHAAAADGSDGKYHWESIDDFHEFGMSLFNELEKELDDAIDHSSLWDIDRDLMQQMSDKLLIAFEQCQTDYQADCHQLEEWHEKNGTLNQEIG